MSLEPTKPVKALFEKEKAIAEKKKRAEKVAPPPVVPSEKADVPEGMHAPVTNAAARRRMEAVSAPEFGSKGKPKGKSIEVEIAGGTESASSTEAAMQNESAMLDAYWGSYGDPGTNALVRRQKKGESILEVVIGNDDRVRVGKTGVYPWRCIASLRITAADGTGWIGTGWLVGPRTLLTAGHCVFISNHGGWAKSIEVIPGRDVDNFPFQSCIATDFRSVRGWTENNDREFDYAAILLPESCRFGDQTGWFGYEVRSDDNLENLTINISGYPGDKPDGTQWFHSNAITDVDDKTITYQTDTAGGQSGAPVWVKKADGRYAVGIHTNGAVTGNSATRITQEVFDNITNWKAEVP